MRRVLTDGGVAAADEPEHPPAGVVGNRQDDPVTEPVDEAGVPGGRGQPGGLQFGAGDALAAQVIQQPGPPGRGVSGADVRMAGDVAAETVDQVVAGPATGRQLLLVVVQRHRVDLRQTLHGDRRLLRLGSAVVGPLQVGVGRLQRSHEPAVLRGQGQPGVYLRRVEVVVLVRRVDGGGGGGDRLEVLAVLGVGGLHRGRVRVEDARGQLEVFLVGTDGLVQVSRVVHEGADGPGHGRGVVDVGSRCGGGGCEVVQGPAALQGVVDGGDQRRPPGAARRSSNPLDLWPRSPRRGGMWETPEHPDTQEEPMAGATYDETAVPVEQLLLDPNNFRFQDEEEWVRADPERFAEPSVQERASKRIRSEGLIELKNSILSNGFLSVERLVVRQYKQAEDGDPQLFLVLEGNRRLAALQWIKQDDEAGVATPASVVAVISAVPVIVIHSDNDAGTYLSIMGIRHVGGIKQWGGYQRAKLVADLRDLRLRHH